LGQKTTLKKKSYLVDKKVVEGRGSGEKTVPFVFIGGGIEGGERVRKSLWGGITAKPLPKFSIRIMIMGGRGGNAGGNGKDSFSH